MVCIYCNFNTSVTNSRLQKRSNSVWRRRSCSNCQNVFSTKEIIDLTQAVRMELRSGELAPFDSYNIFISLHECLKHRDQPINDATHLLNTVISTLLKQKQTIITRNEIINTVVKILKRFDKASAVSYQAFHKL